MALRERPGDDELEVEQMLVTNDPILAEFDRLAQQFFGSSEGVAMPIDVVRHGDELVVRIDVPGVSQDKIGLDVDRHVLTVTAERHAAYDDGVKILTQERFDGTMTRRLRIPEWVDVERIGADYADGVLTITLPMAEQARPRRIAIRPGVGGQEAITSHAAA
jgi:HSP20 family protein